MSSIMQSWIETYPELKTRPLLLAELQTNNALRGMLFHHLNCLDNIASLGTKNPKVALQVMGIYYAHVRRWLRSIQGELEERDRHLFNELVGMLKNFYINLVLRVKPRAHIQRGINSNWVSRRVKLEEVLL